MRKKYCFYRKDRLLNRLRIDGLVYLESNDNDVIFHTLYGDYKVRMPFQSALDLLIEEPLVRIHRSFAVFLEHIETIGPDTVTVSVIERKELPVSKKYYRDLMNSIVILEAMKDCGCDVKDLDSEEKLERWRMERGEEEWDREQGGEEEENV
jgi:hypothetical protein